MTELLSPTFGLLLAIREGLIYGGEWWLRFLNCLWLLIEIWLEAWQVSKKLLFFQTVRDNETYIECFSSPVLKSGRRISFSILALIFRTSFVLEPTLSAFPRNVPALKTKRQVVAISHAHGKERYWISILNNK